MTKDSLLFFIAVCQRCLSTLFVKAVYTLYANLSIVLVIQLREMIWVRVRIVMRGRVESGVVVMVVGQ